MQLLTAPSVFLPLSPPPRRPLVSFLQSCPLTITLESPSSSVSGQEHPSIRAHSVTAIAGGNTLEKAPSGPVTDFVKQHGGHTVITKVSITLSDAGPWDGV